MLELIIKIGMAIVAYGITFAYFQGKYPEYRGAIDSIIGLVQALLILASSLGKSLVLFLFVFLITRFAKYGIQFKPLPPVKDES